MPLQFNTNAFLNRLQSVTAAQERAVDRYVAETAVDIEGDIREATPVDTGALRASWHRQRMEAAHWRIATNLHYAVTVEYGLYARVGPGTVESDGGIYSRKAPAGMMRITLAKHRPDFGAGVLRALRETA
jgi:hypothetical protein